MSVEPSAGSGVFDQLVSGLSSEERQDLLSRIRIAQTVDTAPLRETEPTPDARFDQVFAGLSILERILLFIRRVLTRKDRVALVEEFSLRRIVKSVGIRGRDFFSPRTMQLLEPFSREIERLRDSATFFRRHLREALGEQRRDFVAFLAGLELPVIQEQLMRESDPENHDGLIIQMSEFDMRRSIDSSLQDVYAEIGEHDRRTMYRDIQLLQWLLALADFDFGELLRPFGTRGTDRRCSANTLVSPLKELASILQQLTAAPSTQLVGSFFLFALRDRLSETDFDLDGVLQTELERARNALEGIRHFNAAIPLNDIIRVVVNDADWVPSLKGGGEDWFVLFKQFWSARMEKLVGQYVEQRARRQLLAAAQKMLNLADLPYLAYYRSHPREREYVVRHEHSIAFLRGFLEQVFDKQLNRPIKIFLLDGKFYKEDNRKDFTDAYNIIEQLPERIRNLDKSLAPTGARGRRLEQIADEQALPSTREKAVDAVISAADKDAEMIVLDGRSSLHLLQLVLDGMLHGHGEGAYDTLSNLRFVGGRENRRLVMGLRDALGRLAAANEILRGLIELEVEEKG